MWDYSPYSLNVCFQKKKSMNAVRTQVRQISIAETEPLSIQFLYDQQQFHDPKGHAAALGICSASWPLFGMLWPSSIQLATQIALRPVSSTERILELGCGLGLASLVAHRRGAQITASDRHPMAARFLDANQARNGLTGLRYRHAQWGAEVCSVLLGQMGVEEVSHTYDLVIASDLLYERDTPPLLAQLMDQVAKPSAEIWVVDPNRGHHNAFSRAVSAYGFKLIKNKCLRHRTLYDEQGEVMPYKGRLLVYQRHADSLLADLQQPS